MSSSDSYVSLSLSNPTMGNDWGKQQGEIADLTPQHVGCGDGWFLIQITATYNPEMEETGAGVSRPDNVPGQQHRCQRCVGVEVCPERAAEEVSPDGLKSSESKARASAPADGRRPQRIVTYMAPFENMPFVRKVCCQVEHQEEAAWPLPLYRFTTHGRSHEHGGKLIPLIGGHYISSIRGEVDEYNQKENIGVDFSIHGMQISNQFP